MFCRKISIIILASFVLLSFSSCGKEAKDDEYYEIDYQKIETTYESDKLLEKSDDDIVIPTKDDEYDFYVSNEISIKELLGYSDDNDVSLNKLLAQDINLTRQEFGVDLGSYYVYSISKTSVDMIPLRDIIDNKPTVFVFLDAFCDACEDFNTSFVTTIDSNKYNYCFIMPDNSEEQIAYLEARGINLDKCYVLLANPSGEKFLNEMNTPGSIFVSSNGLIRVINQYVHITSDNYNQFLSFLVDEYYPIDNK